MDELIKHYEEFKDRKDMDKDASYEAFAGLYLPVYSRIKVFSENFDFDNPCLLSSGGCSRIAVPAKRDGPLYIAFTENLKEIPVKVGTEKYSLCNYSMMPITGALNNDKGKKGKINDNWAMFVKSLPDLIKNPHTHNGRYRKEFQPYKVKIVVAARRAYYNLFDNDIYNYCRNVYFFGVETDKTKSIIDYVLDRKGEIEGGEYTDLACEYWNLRAKILKENYGINKL